MLFMVEKNKEIIRWKKDENEKKVDGEKKGDGWKREKGDGWKREKGDGGKREKGTEENSHFWEKGVCRKVCVNCHNPFYVKNQKLVIDQNWLYCYYIINQN